MKAPSKYVEDAPHPAAGDAKLLQDVQRYGGVYDPKTGRLTANAPDQLADVERLFDRQIDD